jgi:large subunit ribosomal protein L29
MTIKEVRELSVDEMHAKLKDLKSELMNLRFQNSVRQLDNPQRIVEVRRSIARILTVLHETELGKAE